jgi:hypothetical protein
MKIFLSIKKRFLTFFSFLFLTVGAIGTIGSPYTSLSHFGREEKEGSVIESSWSTSGNNTSTLTMKSSHVTIQVSGSSTVNTNTSSPNPSVRVSGNTSDAVSINATLKISITSTLKMTSFSFSFGQSGLSYQNSIACTCGGVSVSDNYTNDYVGNTTSNICYSVC